MSTILKMFGYGIFNAVIVVVAWKGMDALILALDLWTPSPKNYWDIFFGAAAGAANVIAWMED